MHYLELPLQTHVVFVYFTLPIHTPYIAMFVYFVFCFLAPPIYRLASRQGDGRLAEEDLPIHTAGIHTAIHTAAHTHHCSTLFRTIVDRGHHCSESIESSVY